jgi:hypothetical protein
MKVILDTRTTKTVSRQIFGVARHFIWRDNSNRAK